MKLSILIPVYNDKDYIEPTITQIRKVDFPIPCEIVAVDDYSTDGSREVLEGIPDIVKIFHKKNIGKGGAVRTGLGYVSGDIVAIQDDDCEYSPTVLPRLIEPILQGQAQVVYGSRFLGQNFLFPLQRAQNYAITFITNCLLGQRLTDVETGHKVFTRDVARRLDLKKAGFEFDMEITLQIIRLGYTIKELPTQYTARSKAQGKKITYRDGIRTIATLLKYRFNHF